MFGRKKPNRQRPKSAKTGSGLTQFGLIDIPDLNNMDSMSGGLSDDDSDLEAELLALTSDAAPSSLPKRAQPKSAPPPQLDAMVAASMKDIPSDESVSGDDDDPDLLDELSAITGEVLNEPPPQTETKSSITASSASQHQLLAERLSMYKEAEAKAISVGETARARRFNRAIKTLGDLIKQVAAGKVIDEEDIPPLVSISASSKPSTTPSTPPTPALPDSVPMTEAGPTRVAPPPPVPPRSVRLGVALPGLTPDDRGPPSALTSSPEAPKPIQPMAAPVAPVAASSDKDNIILMLTERRDQYKRAALQAKKGGDTNLALSYVKIAKQFDSVISGVEADQPVDLSEMPPPPPSVQEVTSNELPPMRKRRSSENQSSSEPETAAALVPEPEATEADVEEEYTVEMPKTILEALEQRLAKYISQEEAAKAENNSSKVRRMGRIVKQYNDAIKQHKAGKSVAFEDLPTPPGYPPIPVPGLAKAVSQPQPQIPKPSPGSSISVLPQSPQSPAKNSKLNISSDQDNSAEKLNVRKMGGSRQEKQLALLLDKQKQFKLAALEAKKKGEISQAKEYLRLAKGFDPLIEASNCGLPVDMNSVPVSPENKKVLESDFDVVSADDCSPGSDSDIYDKLEADLLTQLKKFMETRNHFKAIGDVTSANRFEQQALSTKKDLDFVKFSHKNKHPVPKFHYEMRSFSIVQCNTELGDNEVELVVVQGINYNVPNPKEVDTYIRFEFPYPSEDHFRDKTAVVYNTNNPVYDEKFTIPIQRSAKACQRIFKRQALKCEVWAKGGFFRSDSLIGTVSIKLQPLENVCIIHDAINLMDGRKAVGGKLEVKIRVRNPILTKQIEQVQEKWLVIDN